MSIQESLGAGSGGLLNSIVAAMATRYQEKAVQKMDADGSGGVDKSEFQAALDKISGKYGIDFGESAGGLFTAADADGNGSLNASEMGKAIQNLFAPSAGTQAFVQNRGDEARFAELDTDGDGMISRAEFGIPEGTVVSMTTTTTTTVISTGAEGGEQNPLALAALGGSQPPASASWQPTQGMPIQTAAPVAGDPAAVQVAGSEVQPPQDALQADTLTALLKQADTDGDGQISGSELSALVAQLSNQMEAASRRYNDVALASSGLTAGGEAKVNASA